MKNRDAFSAFHPAVLCGYYALVLVFSMFLTHPLCLAASLLGALSYAAKLRGGRAVLRSLAWMAPVWLLAAAVNVLFNHEGATILTYFSSGNPLTLESMLYGLSAGGMLAAVLLWFTTYQAVMTSDKFVYLFGRAIPALSLVLSMTLRFVPKFRAQLRAVQQARQFAGNSEKTGPIQKVRTSVENFSILVTWSLENAVETADSMRARGYGLADDHGGLMDLCVKGELTWNIGAGVALSGYVAYYDYVFDSTLRDAARAYEATGRDDTSYHFVGGLALTASF